MSEITFLLPCLWMTIRWRGSFRSMVSSLTRGRLKKDDEIFYIDESLFQQDAGEARC